MPLTALCNATIVTQATIEAHDVHYPCSVCAAKPYDLIAPRDLHEACLIAATTSRHSQLKCCQVASKSTLQQQVLPTGLHHGQYSHPQFVPATDLVASYAHGGHREALNPLFAKFTSKDT
eukprot:1176-Heterococcus_DN1.PRE.1